MSKVGDAPERRAALDAGIAAYQAGFTWLHRPDIVSIAAVRGHAIGAGFQLALAADLRILTDDAVLVMAEARLGLVPDLGGTRNLVEVVGYGSSKPLVEPSNNPKNRAVVVTFTSSS